MYANKDSYEELIDASIKLAEVEPTVMAKNNISNVQQVTIDAAHTATHKNKTTIRQRGNNMGNTFNTATLCLINNMTRDGKHVQFIRSSTIATYYHNDEATMLTYNSGADRQYLSEEGRKKLGLPI